MMRGDPNWILAFDGDCRTCDSIARSTESASQGRLSVMPLASPQVQTWLKAASASSAQTRPVLIHVAQEKIRVWGGLAMAAKLVKLLGPRKSTAVLSALGRRTAYPLLEAMPDLQETRSESSRPTRRRFMQLGIGIAIAGGVVVTGRVPAFADPLPGWLAGLDESAPKTYDELVKLRTDYRRAAYLRLAPEQKSAVWLDHIAAFKDGRELDRTQQETIERVRIIAGDMATFAPDAGPYAEADGVESAAKSAFGHDAARELFAVLGPVHPEPQNAVLAACQCSTASDYCSGSRSCRRNAGGCSHTSGGCGFLYTYNCDGGCQ